MLESDPLLPCMTLIPLCGCLMMQTVRNGLFYIVCVLLLWNFFSHLYSIKPRISSDPMKPYPLHILYKFSHDKIQSESTVDDTDLISRMPQDTNSL